MTRPSSLVARARPRSLLSRGAPHPRDGQALEAASRRPDPPALIPGVARTTHLAHDDRPVAIRVEGLADQSERAREPGLLSSHPARALPEAGRMLLEAHHDLPVTRNRVRPAGPAGHRAPQVHHAGRLFPAEGAGDVAAVPPQAHHDLPVRARLNRGTEVGIARLGIGGDRSQEPPVRPALPDAGLLHLVGIEDFAHDRVAVAARRQRLDSANEDDSARRQPVESATRGQAAHDGEIARDAGGQHLVWQLDEQRLVGRLYGRRHRECGQRQEKPGCLIHRLLPTSRGVCRLVPFDGPLSRLDRTLGHMPCRPEVSGA
jgi:hypothetical protein